MVKRKDVDDILESGWNALRTGERYVDRLTEAGVDKETLKSLEEYLHALEMMEKKQSPEEIEPFALQIRELLEDCYGWGVKLRLRMESVYGRHSEEFHAFPSDMLSKGRRHLSVMTEAMDVMLTIAKRHHGVLQKHGQSDAEVIFGENLQKRLLEMHTKARFLQKSSKQDQRRDLLKKIRESTDEIKDAGESVFKNQPEVQKNFQKIDRKM